jgi:hypothetical protein
MGGRRSWDAVGALTGPVGADPPWSGKALVASVEDLGVPRGFAPPRGGVRIAADAAQPACDTHLARARRVDPDGMALTLVVCSCHDAREVAVRAH